eukprot:10503256-Alexandrium_andersonii.AAC.1
MSASLVGSEMCIRDRRPLTSLRLRRLVPEELLLRHTLALLGRLRPRRPESAAVFLRARRERPSRRSLFRGARGRQGSLGYS